VKVLVKVFLICHEKGHEKRFQLVLRTAHYFIDSIFRSDGNQ